MNTQISISLVNDRLLAESLMAQIKGKIKAKYPSADDLLQEVQIRRIIYK